MEKDEQAVQDLILYMDNLDADPLDECAPELCSLQSDVITSPEGVC